jgi:hypothetical protein
MKDELLSRLMMTRTSIMNDAERRSPVNRSNVLVLAGHQREGYYVTLKIITVLTVCEGPVNVFTLYFNFVPSYGCQ